MSDVQFSSCASPRPTVSPIRLPGPSGRLAQLAAWRNPAAGLTRRLSPPGRMVQPDPSGAVFRLTSSLDRAPVPSDCMAPPTPGPVRRGVHLNFIAHPPAWPVRPSGPTDRLTDPPVASISDNGPSVFEPPRGFSHGPLLLPRSLAHFFDESKAPWRFCAGKT